MTRKKWCGKLWVKIRGMQLDDGELDKSTTCKDYLQVQNEGNREISGQIKHYNLQVISAIGYWVRSTVS